MGIRDKPISAGSPWQNCYAERLIGTIRRECVDHLMVLGEAHLRRVLVDFAAYYSTSAGPWLIPLDQAAPDVLNPLADIPEHADTTESASGYVALANMKVSTANRGLRYLDDRVGRCRDLRFWPLFESFLADGLIDESFHRRTARCVVGLARVAGFGIVVRVMISTFSKMDAAESAKSY